MSQRASGGIGPSTSLPTPSSAVCEMRRSAATTARMSNEDGRLVAIETTRDLSRVERWPKFEIDETELNIREKLAHIDQMLADADRKRQELRLAPWQLILTGMATGVGLL